MAPLNPPWAMSAPAAHTHDHFRRLIRALIPTYGVVQPTDLAVSANGTPNMSVNIAAGFVVLPASEQATAGGGPAAYAAYNDAVVNVTVAAADPTNPRRDLVVARVLDAQYSGGSSLWGLAVVTGTPAASPADPAAPNNSVILARLAVAANATSITSGVITDLRNRASSLGGVITCTSTTRPGAAGTPMAYLTPVPGMTIYETDTGKAMTYYSATTGWQPADWNSSWGRQAFASMSAPLSGITGTYTDVPGLSVVGYTPPGNRITRASWRFFFQSTVGTDVVASILLVDGAQVQQVNRPVAGNAAWALSMEGEMYLNLTAAAHTIKVQVHRDAGTGTIAGPGLSGTYAQYLSLEDVGPTGAPV